MLQWHKEFEEVFAHSSILSEKSQKLYSQQFSQFSNWMSDQQLYQKDKREGIQYEQDFNHKKIEVLSQMLSYLEKINKTVEKM